MRGKLYLNLEVRLVFYLKVLLLGHRIEIGYIGCILFTRYLPTMKRHLYRNNDICVEIICKK